jgi:hypothetical protein
MRLFTSSRIPVLVLAGLGSLTTLAIAQEPEPRSKPEPHRSPATPQADPGLAFAPAPTEIDGLLATPIDIHKVSATAVFDLEMVKADATAEMHFVMSATGMPVFDLRQDITKAWLDGEEIDPGTMAAHDFGKGASTMRILERTLESQSEHVLRFEYPLRQPQSRQSDPIGWGDLNTLTWDFFFSDLNPGRYLEMWFPSNLIYDQFPFSLDLQLKNAGSKHLLLTNGAAEEKGKHHWMIVFPKYFTPISHMLTVVPAADVDTAEKTITTPDGQKIKLEVAVRKDAGATVKQTIRMTADAIEEFTESTGPWVHGPRCVVYVWPGTRSMEYDGATTTAIDALEHELFHSWYARGVKPADQNTGWMDEAWDMVNTSRIKKSWLDQEPTSPVQLSFENPWNRTTPGLSYSSGAKFFAQLMGRVGVDEFRKLMADFYVKYALKVVSTETLQQFLIQETGDEGIEAMFSRYVYGKDVEIPSKD